MNLIRFGLFMKLFVVLFVMHKREGEPMYTYSIDYEDLILARQEAIEIAEDDPDSAYFENWWDEIDPTLFA